MAETERTPSSALFTDLYELTMACAYAAESMTGQAVFELFFRKMPATRNFILAAGLDDVLRYLESWRFTPDDREYLAGTGIFPDDFLDALLTLRFTGDVYAVAEGTVVFQNEPIVQVVAPIIQAQIVETYVLNQIHFQSIAATKAARIVMAAADRGVVDFGSRRAHGTDAALKVARLSYLAGALGTSNVLAGKLYGIPILGTMAHSYIQAHRDEEAAFAAFARIFPQTTLLVDTYDSLEGVAEVIRLAGRLGKDFHVRAIRLDSGDLGSLAHQSRQLLDAAGLQAVRIFASSELDEAAIASLVRQGVPIDTFGVGTRMAVSPDAPALDMAYKLVEYDATPCVKLATAKVIYPGRKQVYRFMENGCLHHDRVCRCDERPGGTPLLRQVMVEGKRTPAGMEPLDSCRARAARELAALPEPLRAAEKAEPYPVGISDALQEDLRRFKATRGFLPSQQHSAERAG